MYHANVKTMRDLRNNTTEIMKIIEGHDQVVITENGRETAVIIDYGDYIEYESYLHQTYVRKKLEATQKKSEDPNTEWITHGEFWEKVENNL